ncbi:MAG: insulinase family protein, partial [Candidatus Omnitrophota bacterium]
MPQPINSILAVFAAATLLVLSPPQSNLCAEQHEAELFQQPPVHRTVLDNGLTLLVSEKEGAGIVCLEVRLKAGSAQEGSYVGSGISHLIEHMLFKGTRERSPEEIDRSIKSYGGRINGATSLDTTYYSVSVLPEYLRQTAAILKDMMTNAAFDEKELQNEKRVVLHEMKFRRDDPTRRIMLRLWEQAYIRHPYRFPVIGYEEALKKISRDDIVAYYRTVYAPNKMIVTITGDIKTGEAETIVREVFGAIEPGSYRSAVNPIEPDQVIKRSLDESIETNLAYLAMGFHSTSLLDRNLFALDVLAIILGRGDESRLNTSLVKEDEIAYSVSAYNYTPKDPGLFIISAVTDTKNIDKVARNVLKNIDVFKHERVSDDDLERAKNQVLGDYIFSRQSVQALASDIAQSEELTGSAAFSERYVAGIRSVTRDAIQEVAQRYFAETNLTEVRLTPKPEDTTTAIAALSGDKERSPAEKTVLLNGVTVITQRRTDIPAVSIAAVLGGGLRSEERSKSGISNFTSKMLLKGAANRPESLIQGAVEARGGMISSFSGLNSLGVTISALKSDTNFSLEVLADILRSPDFPKAQIEKERSLILAAIKQEADDPFDAGIVHLRGRLFGGHPYSRRL